MSNVIDIKEHRDGGEGYDGIICVRPGCGSAWFRIEAVCVGQDLNITGYTGLFSCVECGAVFVRRRA